jgi:hypothetical protein
MMDEDIRYAEAELADNQVVQKGSDFDIDLHQSEEIILEANEAEKTVLNEEEEIHHEIEVEELALEQPEESILVDCDKDEIPINIESITEDELSHQLYGVDNNNAEVSYRPSPKDYELYEAEMKSVAKSDNNSEDDFDFTVFVNDKEDTEDNSDFF